MPNTVEVQIDQWIDNHSNDILKFLSNLVQIPSETIPPKGNELACQKFIEAAYRSAKAELDVFDLSEVKSLPEHPAYNGLWDGKPRILSNRPVVVGTFRGSGNGRSILFSTHVDTVQAAEKKAWNEAGPFSGLIKNGKLYGRGSWDTKWGIATSLFAARCVRELFPSIAGNIIIESVPDEEFGGSHGVIAARLRGHNADVAINSEPTSMVVTPVHRGGTAWKIIVKGETGRSFGGGKLENPIYKIARVIEAIRSYDGARSPINNPPPFYESDPWLPTYIQQVAGGGTSFAEAIGSPSECHISIWIEEHPGTDFENHKDRLISFINSYLANGEQFDGIYPEYKQLFRYIPGSSIDLEHPIFSSINKAFDSTNISYKIDGARLACDTYVFNHFFNIPALTLGPHGGNAHTADEFVVVQDVIDLTRIYARIILDWCS